MNGAVAAPPIPSDPGLPGGRGLFEGEGSGALASFLADRGWEMEEARPVQAMYRPGRSCLVRYRVRAAGPQGRATLSLCAETRARVRQLEPVGPGPGARGGLPDPVGHAGPYLVWAFPHDPSLPDLPDVAWGPAVRDRLASTGVPASAVAVQALRYRPGRRAVFRYRILRRDRGIRRWETAFGKVVPRSKSERIAATAGLRMHLSPGVRLGLPAGALGRHAFLFEPLEGRSLRDLLVAGASLPSPERVAGLPLSLAGTTAPGPSSPDRRRDLASLMEPAAELAERLVPEDAHLVRQVVEAATEGAGRDEAPTVTVHGDLYEAQVFVDRDFSLGLIDLDDLGPGDPVSDAANFCAHLLALALSVPAAAGRLVAYRTLVRRAFLDRLDVAPVALAWREALAMLLLATGPFRVLDPRWPAEVGRRVRLAVRLLQAT